MHITNNTPSAQTISIFVIKKSRFVLVAKLLHIGSMNKALTGLKQ